MRARLMMKLVSLAVMLVITAMGARSCNGADAKSSPLSPANLLNNGLSGLCANQQAVAGAAGDPSAPSGFQVPASDAALARLAGVDAGSLTCPTGTTAPGG